MYTHELKNLVKDGMVKREDYIENINYNASPQISKMELNPFSKEITVWTKDSDPFSFKIVV